MQLEGGNRQVVNKAAPIAHFMIGSGEADVYRYADKHPSLDDISVGAAVRDKYALQPGWASGPKWGTGMGEKMSYTGSAGLLRRHKAVVRVWASRERIKAVRY